MNNKAQTILYGMMVGLVILILALALAFPVQDSIEKAKNQTDGDTIGMNCSTTTDNFVKAGCYMSDVSSFSFIGVLIFIGGGFVAARVMFN